MTPTGNRNDSGYIFSKLIFRKIFIPNYHWIASDIGKNPVAPPDCILNTPMTGHTAYYVLYVIRTNVAISKRILYIY